MGEKMGGQKNGWQTNGRKRMRGYRQWSVVRKAGEVDKWFSQEVSGRIGLGDSVPFVLFVAHPWSQGAGLTSRAERPFVQPASQSKSIQPDIELFNHINSTASSAVDSPRPLWFFNLRL
jgi:hypothetical protein